MNLQIRKIVKDCLDQSVINYTNNQVQMMTSSVEFNLERNQLTDEFYNRLFWNSGMQLYTKEKQQKFLTLLKSCLSKLSIS